MLRKTWIIIVALILLTAAGVSSSARADGTPTPEPDHMHMEGTPEADSMHMDDTADSEQHDMSMPEMDHEHGDRIDANGAAVKIVTPQDGEVLNVPTVIVRVETTSWPLGEEGHHFHLYVNGAEQGMSQGNSPALQARDLQPGENVLEVVLSNDLHQELNATDMITIRYESSGDAAPAAAPVLSSGVVIVLLGISVTVAAILGIGFAATRKKRAA